MLGWVRKVFGFRPAPPTDERSIKAEQLNRAAAEVREQTASVRRIRLEAELAHRRIRR